MSARRIDGTAIAAQLGAKIGAEVARLHKEHGLEPGLAVVLVGSNPASEVYVRNKTAKTAATGMRSSLHKLPETVSESDLLAKVAQLNADPAVHGILVQLPLPPRIDPQKVIEAIAPAKDVDGFHPLTAGLLATGLPGLRPRYPRRRERAGAQLARLARQVRRLRHAHQRALPAGRTAGGRRRCLVGLAFRLRRRGARRDAVPLVHDRAGVHRP